LIDKSSPLQLGEHKGEADMADSNDGTRSIENSVDAEEMIRFGIIRVPIDHFQYKTYRYTNLKDAIAQAERDQQLIQSA
jgi:hypothetical protein